MDLSILIVVAMIIALYAIYVVGLMRHAHMTFSEALVAPFVGRKDAAAAVRAEARFAHATRRAPAPKAAATKSRSAKQKKR